MDTNKKGFTTIILIVVIVILVGAVGYFASRKPSTEPTIFPTNGNNQPIQPQVTPSPTANQAPPPPQAGMLRYQSIHGFSIDYPANWNYDSTIEEFGSIAEAEKSSGNHFSIFNYSADAYYNNTGPTQNAIKIETWIFDNAQGSLDEWVESLVLETMLRTENISINGKNAKKILYDGELGPIFSIYYIDGSRKVRSTAYSFSSDTKYPQEFDAIVKTLRFTN